MAISVNGGGNSGGGRRRFHGSSALADINVTPFVDVVLVLLIIFMMTAHVMESGIEVDVPKTTTTKESTKELPQVIITSDGQFFLNEKSVGNIHSLAEQIKSRFPNQKEVYLKADKETPWDVAVQVMSELGDGGFAVNVVTQPEDQAKKKGRRR